MNLINQKPATIPRSETTRPDMVSQTSEWVTGLAVLLFILKFEKNGLFYTAHTEPGGHNLRISAYTDKLESLSCSGYYTEMEGPNNPNAKNLNKGN